MKPWLVFLALPLLTACERDPGTPTVEENRQLDEAGQMLNEAPANLEAVDDYGFGDTDNSDAPD